jgi:hypothetical protein
MAQAAQEMICELISSQLDEIVSLEKGDRMCRTLFGESLEFCANHFPATQIAEWVIDYALLLDMED